MKVFALHVCFLMIGRTENMTAPTWSRAIFSSACCWVPARTKSRLESCILKSLMYNPVSNIFSRFSILTLYKGKCITDNNNKLLEFIEFLTRLGRYISSSYLTLEFLGTRRHPILTCTSFDLSSWVFCVCHQDHHHPLL